MLDFVYSILPGIGEMENIHPMIVHFPIALLNAFILMEVLGYLLKKEELRIAATWMLYLGTLGALAAVVAGFQAAYSVPHNDEIHLVMIKHRNLGIVVLILASVLSIWRVKTRGNFSAKNQIVHIAIAGLMTATMAFGADLGGLMVYKYGVAVKAVPQAEGHDHSAHGKAPDKMDMSGDSHMEEKSDHHEAEKKPEKKTHHDSTPHDH